MVRWRRVRIWVGWVRHSIGSWRRWHTVRARLAKGHQCTSLVGREPAVHRGAMRRSWTLTVREVATAGASTALGERVGLMSSHGRERVLVAVGILCKGDYSAAGAGTAHCVWVRVTGEVRRGDGTAKAARGLLRDVAPLRMGMMLAVRETRVVKSSRVVVVFGQLVGLIRRRSRRCSRVMLPAVCTVSGARLRVVARRGPGDRRQAMRGGVTVDLGTGSTSRLGGMAAAVSVVDVMVWVMLVCGRMLGGRRMVTAQRTLVAGSGGRLLWLDLVFAEVVPLLTGIRVFLVAVGRGQVGDVDAGRVLFV